MFLPHPVNGAQSNRHDTASRRGVTGARGVNPAEPDRGAERPQSGPDRASRSGAGRENEKSDRQALAAEEANGRDDWNGAAASAKGYGGPSTRGELPGGFGGHV